MRDYFATAPANIFLMRGVEGEPVVRLHAPQPIEFIGLDGLPVSLMLEEGEAGYPPSGSGCARHGAMDRGRARGTRAGAARPRAPGRASRGALPQGRRASVASAGVEQVKGKVYLVGAGPGDPELLTLKAARVLKRADVILCDDLVHDEVLAHARPDVRVVRVGKRGGRPSTSQEFIERLMIAEARHGRIVVRLKGGDPMIFGRGGEECAALRAAGIDFEVVKRHHLGPRRGHRVGAPLTHRDLCQGAIFVTGTAQDWRALVRTGMPLVIYMGWRDALGSSQALLDAGMPPAMPAAAVSNATRADESSVVTRSIASRRRCSARRIASPAILLIGKTIPVLEVAQEIQQHVGG
jgi:uroporphyrin-III C-methyltransferase